MVLFSLFGCSHKVFHSSFHQTSPCSLPGPVVGLADGVQNKTVSDPVPMKERSGGERGRSKQTEVLGHL